MYTMASSTMAEEMVWLYKYSKIKSTTMATIVMICSMAKDSTTGTYTNTS